MSQENPKILVGTPTCDRYEYCWDEYWEALSNLDYDNYDILIVDNSEKDNYYEKLKSQRVPIIKDKFTPHARDRIVSSRNLLRKKVLEENYDYFLSLEQDVIPPKDIIKRLLSHNKKVITGIYYSRFMIDNFPRLMPLLWKPRDEKNEIMDFFTPEEVEGDKLIQARSCGMGCLLIHKDILKKIKFNYSKEKGGFDDVYFCNDLVQNNIPLFADTSVKCKHLIEGRTWSDILK